MKPVRRARFWIVRINWGGAVNPKFIGQAELLIPNPESVSYNSVDCFLENIMLCEVSN
jgi:hypothetical protein